MPQIPDKVSPAHHVPRSDSVIHNGRRTTPWSCSDLADGHSPQSLQQSEATSMSR